LLFDIKVKKYTTGLVIFHCSGLRASGSFDFSKDNFCINIIVDGEFKASWSFKLSLIPLNTHFFKENKKIVDLRRLILIGSINQFFQKYY